MPVKPNQSKVDALALEAEKEKRKTLCAEVTAERIRRLGEGFIYDGTAYPMDVEAQGVYTALANAINAGIPHANIIRTMDNRTIEVSAEAMAGIGTACLMAAGAINIAAWTAKDAIRSVATYGEAEAIFNGYMKG